MSAPLPRLIELLIRATVPRHRVDQVIADLEDDYAAAAPHRARRWLARETASLVMAYAMAAIGRLGSPSMWIRDLRMVLRGLRRAPLPALGAAAMLSTGLLAVLLTGGLAKTLLFRQVSATHGDALRRVGAVDRQGRSALRLSYIELQVIREHLAGAGAVSAVNMQPVVLRVHGRDVQTMAEVVDGQYFALTGTQTIAGRGLMGADDRPAAPPVTVIAEPLWRRQFGASPTAIGQTIELNGEGYTVVGIARALGSSSFLGASVDAWVPLAHADPLLNRGWRTNIENRWFTSFVLPASASAEVDGRLAAAAADLARLHPEQWRERRLQTSPATTLTGGQRSSVTMLASILAGLAALILATAASNVGGVLLARAAAMRRHVAIHLSIGSGRTAMVRRQLLEGALLGLAGAAIAMAFYIWARTWLAEIALLPTLAVRLDLPLDASLIALVTGAGIATGTVLALGPALWATRVDLGDAMRDADYRASGAPGATRIRRLLVAAQVCLTLALVVGAALFTRSLTAMATIDLGFARERLVAMDFDVEPSGPSLADLPALARVALARAETTTGVAAAAMSNRAPIDQSTPSIAVRSPAQNASAPLDVTFYLATARYFETVGIPIVAGRPFTAAETDSMADVAVVNETLARRLWPDGDALERPLELVNEGKTVRVVGVARDSKYRSISETQLPHLYRPTPPTMGLTLLARTTDDPRQTLRALQQTLDAVGPGIVGFFPRTLDDHLAIDLLPTRAAAATAAVLGTLAVVLSAVGLYGLVSWFVELRRREIGIRMALGASAADVRALVMRQALSAAIPGVVAGVMLSVSLGLLARAALFGVGPFDPAALGAGIGALAIVVALAAFIPSRRATQVEASTSLRH
jgi:predicted permease